MTVVIYRPGCRSLLGKRLMSAKLKTALVTGASTGIGATSAHRLAYRGHDLILVARDVGKMEALATRLRSETGVAVDVLGADLTSPSDRGRVEQRLREDEHIGLLVNNAGSTVAGGFADPDLDKNEALIALNVTAVARLSGAVIPGLLARGEGAIINVSSVLALGPEIAAGLYAASKSFVLTFSQSLQTELVGKGLYVQAVLPAATRTGIWNKSDRELDEMPGLMEVGEMVDAALVGFDRREAITVPPLPDEALWTTFSDARLALMQTIAQKHAAARYRA